MNEPVKRKLNIYTLDRKTEQEVEFPADTVVLNAMAAGEKISLVIAVPASDVVSRKVWMIAEGGDVPAQAQEGDFVGIVAQTTVVELSTVKAGHVAVFVETQSQAVLRSQSRRR